MGRRGGTLIIAGAAKAPTFLCFSQVEEGHSGGQSLDRHFCRRHKSSLSASVCANLAALR